MEFKSLKQSIDNTLTLMFEEVNAVDVDKVDKGLITLKGQKLHNAMFKFFQDFQQAIMVARDELREHVFTKLELKMWYKDFVDGKLFVKISNGSTPQNIKTTGNILYNLIHQNIKF